MDQNNIWNCKKQFYTRKYIIIYYSLKTKYLNVLIQLDNLVKYTNYW